LSLSVFLCQLTTAGCACVQAIQTDGCPTKLTYEQSTDQVWVQQALDNRRRRHRHHQHTGDTHDDDDDDDDDDAEVVVIRQASQRLLHAVVHIDTRHHQHQQQQSGHDNRPTAVCHLIRNSSIGVPLSVKWLNAYCNATVGRSIWSVRSTVSRLELCY